MMKSITDHNARLLNVFTLFQGTIFVLPVLLPYYRDEIGLGFWEFMVGEAVFSAIVLLCEVPTGWLADHWRRKGVLAMAGIAGLAGYTLLLLADSFLVTVIAQGVIGLSVSLVSGAMQALHYDSLLMDGRTDEYRRQEGRRHGMGLLAVGVSSLIGGFMYEAHATLPLIATILSEFGMIATALMMREPARNSVAQKQNPLIAMGQTLKYALHGHKEVAAIIFSCAALFGTTKMLMWAQQPYYASIHLDEKWFGILLSIGFFTGALASNIGHILDGRFKNRTVLFAMMVAVTGICVTSAVVHSIGGAVLLLSGTLFWGLGWPRVQDTINSAVDSSRRTTVLSTASLMIHVVFIPLSLIVGWVSDQHGIGNGVLSLGVVPAIGAIVLLRGMMRKAETPGNTTP